MAKIAVFIYSVISSLILLYYSHLGTRLIKGMSKVNILLILIFILISFYNDVKSKAIIKQWCLFVIGFFIAYTLLVGISMFADVNNKKEMEAVYEATNKFIIGCSIAFVGFTLYSFTIKN